MMNQFKYITIIFIATILSFAGKAQIIENYGQGMSSQSNILRSKLSGKIYNLQFSTEGSRFYHYDFLPTTITLADGEVHENIMARYDSYINELVCYNPNINALFTIDKFIVKEFEIDSPVRGLQRFVKYETGSPYLGTQFFHVLYEGKITLLGFYKTRDEKTGVYRDKYGLLKDSKLVLTESYFIYSNELGLKRFTGKRKALLRLYEKNKKQVRKLLRKNRIYSLKISNLPQAFSLIEEAGITP